MSEVASTPASDSHKPGIRPSLQEIEERIEALDKVTSAPHTKVAELLKLGEQVLEHWLVTNGETPTSDSKEGFRLLALQRQGAKGDPSFNACRETSRELAYRYNLIDSAPNGPDAEEEVKLAGMVAKHLCLFIAAKMQIAGIGEFCCAAKPLRANGY